MSDKDKSAIEFPECVMIAASRFVAEHMGLCFPRKRWKDLQRGIAAAARELGYIDKELGLKLLTPSRLIRREIEALAGCLTIGETYFYREPQVLDALSRDILPLLINEKLKKDRRLRIWSAGCSTGEEPYTIAMMIDRLIPDLRRWNIKILATDINPRFLEKALAGIYRRWSFRSCPAWILKSYCKPLKDGGIRVCRRIKNMVDFSCLNLVQDPYPSLFNNTNDYDLIFCRNVLMYFDEKIARRVMRGFHRSLIEGGRLITSVAEAGTRIVNPFIQEKTGKVTLLRKGSEKCESVLFNRLVPCAAPDFPERELFLQKPDFRMPSATLRPEIQEVKTGSVQGTRHKHRISSKPSDLEGTYTIACDLYKSGCYDKVIPLLVSLLSGNDAQGISGKLRTKVMALIARSEANRGELKVAIQWAEKALAEDKTDAGIRYLLAGMFFESGLADEAEKMLRGVLFLDQDFVLAHFALGSLAHLKGNLLQRNKSFGIVLSLLHRMDSETILPESDGMTAGSMRQAIEIMMKAF